MLMSIHLLFNNNNNKINNKWLLLLLTMSEWISIPTERIVTDSVTFFVLTLLNLSMQISTIISHGCADPNNTNIPYNWT
eukprot:UN05403